MINSTQDSLLIEFVNQNLFNDLNFDERVIEFKNKFESEFKLFNDDSFDKKVVEIKKLLDEKKFFDKVNDHFIKTDIDKTNIFDNEDFWQTVDNEFNLGVVSKEKHENDKEHNNAISKAMFQLDSIYKSRTYNSSLLEPKLDIQLEIDYASV